MKLKYKINMGVVVGCAGLGVCSSAFSADESTKGKNLDVIETIIVTAERQAQPIQKVPASIQAFSAEDLTSSGINSIEALQNATTGLIMSNNAGQGHAYIRGIGTEIIGGGYEGGVAVYVDGVYQSRPTSLISQFIDVERIEVMKGPQGTLYGRNATGGAINIITAAPGKVSEGQFDAQLGRFSEKTVRGTFSGPLSDGASGRLSLLSSKNDGWMQNILRNNRNDSDTQAVRGSLALAPSSDLSVRLNAHYIDKTDTLLIKPLNPGGTNLMFALGARVIDDPFTVSSDGGQQKNEQSGLDMTIKYDMNWARLTSITAVKKDKWAISNFDNEGTEIPFVICGAPTPFTDDTKMFSQDFTLTSVKAGPIQWTVLASYMHQTVKSPYSCTLPLAGVTLISDPKVTTDSYGIGGQGSYSFDNGVKLTAGARYSSDEKKIVDTTTMNGMVTATQNQENKWSAWTPKLVAEYSPSKETMYFASVTKGFKGGGYNTFTIQAPFNPEHVINYEAGMKSTLLNGKLRINASAFTMEYSDMQLAVVHTVPGGGGAFVSETKNAAKATIDGIEIGVVAKPISRLELSGGMQYLKARFDEFITIDPMLPALGVQNLRDKPLPYAPKSAFNVAAQYSWLGAMDRTDVILRVDASHRSRLYFDAFESNYTSDAPLTLWNAHLRFEPSNDKGIYGVIFVKNIGDKHYSTYTQNTSLGSYAWMAQPRTYGIQVGYRY